MSKEEKIVYEEMDYTKYNFDRPDKFSFEHLRSLESIFTVFSRNLATDISGYLRLPAEIDVKKIDQIPFNAEFLEKKERDANVFCISEFNKEQFLIQFEVGFILRVLSKVLGGEFGKIQQVKKSITEFEKDITEHLLEQYFYPNMREAFKGIDDLEFSLYEIESDPQYARVTLPQDMVALVTLSAKIGNEFTEFQVLLPYLSIESIIEKLNSDNVLKNKKMETSEEQLTNIYDHLLQVKRNFIVNLGSKDIPLSQITQMQKGDVILLDPVENGVVCCIDDKKKFLGKIGKKDGKCAVKVEHTIREKDAQEVKELKAKKIKAFYENKNKLEDDLFE